jgi:hypothetical protein
MKTILIFILMAFFSPLTSWAQNKDLCDILKLQNCPSVMKQSRRSSLQTLPSPSTAATLNPANVSFDRGLGLEFIFQPGNNVNFSLASGTGKVGGAFISSAVENGFFGNRTVETSDAYVDRNASQKQYKSKKINLALGGRLLGTRDFTLDLGVLLKRHNELKDINPGVGLSAKLGILTAGAAVYQDDFIIFQRDSVGLQDAYYDTVFNGSPSYKEKFQVSTFSGGIRINKFAFDVGYIKSKYKFYKEDSNIQLLAASYAYKNIMFNLARRTENSLSIKYIDGKAKIQKEMVNYYSGVQASIGKHWILGIAYNYFLLREVSFNSTFYF